MSPTSRRIVWYWLLLLVPTLVVGATAVVLLSREQARLDQQREATAEARRAATESQSRLIVENIDLLVSDVQEGLLDSLAGARGENVEVVLAEWQSLNPLVWGAFRGTTHGDILWPTGEAASDDVRAFLQRATQLLKEERPWAPQTSVVSGARPLEALAKQKIAKNVSQVQSARRDVQRLLRSTDHAANTTASEAVGKRNERSTIAQAEESQEARSSARIAAAPARAPAQAAKPERSHDGERSDGIEPGATATVRRGWSNVASDGTDHRFGWVVVGDADIRGVELDLQALITRVVAALPEEVAGGEAYELRDERGRVVKRVGVTGRSPVEVLRTPLTNPVLGGWHIVAFAAVTHDKSTGAAFFWVGTVLVGIFAAAIVAGGSLLWRQARRSEAEAAQKTSFVANVTHELKTPLTTIRLFAQLLEQGRVRDDAQRGEYLRTIDHETQRLSRLVNNVLDFSRLEQGRKAFAPAPIELTAFVRSFLDKQDLRLRGTGLELQYELPTGPVALTVDRDALEQILINLIDNAAKYARNGGHIDVSLVKSDPGWELRIADRGPGVPRDHRERIFDMFHRVDDTLTAEQAGAGLGLSIARQLARGLGGDLRYEDRPGGGAVFVLQLP